MEENVSKTLPISDLLDREDKEDKEGIPIPPTKPKIWSMAELAVCKTPPPGSAAAANWSNQQQELINYMLAVESLVQI